MFRKLLVTAASLAMLGGAAFAQESATSNLNVTITNTVYLADVDDVTLTEVSPGYFEGSDEVCFASTLGFVNAAFSGDGGPGPGGFFLTNTATGSTIDFFVDYDNYVDGNANAVDIPSLDGLPSIFGICDGSASGNLRYYFNAAPGMEAGDYAGTVTILLSGE